LRAYLLVIVLLLVIFGSIGGYLYNKFSALAGMDFTPPPVTVGAAVAQPTTWSTRLDAVGTIKAARGVELSSETSGEVIAIDVQSGDRVESGQPILTLNDSVEQASRHRLEANLTLAKVLYERDERLIKKKSIPQSQYDRSKADLDSAIAQLAEIDARLANKRITAPFAGTTGIVRVKIGDYIEPGTPITTLQDLSLLEIDFSVPARHYSLLKPGQKIAVTTSAFPNREFQATLKAIDAQVDANTRNLLMRARLDDSSGLLPGMFARLVVDLGTPERVVTVPETAVSYSLHGNTVWIITQVTGGDAVQPIVVETGPTRDGMIAITKGLLGGERVVTAGQNKLFREARVLIDDKPGP